MDSGRAGAVMFQCQGNEDREFKATIERNGVCPSCVVKVLFSNVDFVSDSAKYTARS